MAENSKSKLHVVMEHFSFEMQHLLSDFQNGNIDIDQLNASYQEIGTEGHDIKAYSSLLNHAKDNKDSVSLVGGFIPRPFAKTLVKEGEEAGIKAAVEKDYLDSSVSALEGSELHYNMFESMISGRSMYDENLKPGDNYRKIFKAQLIKDYAMAYCINKLVKTHADDRFLVIAGKGHLQHFCGVPERVYQEHPDLKDDSSLVVAYCNEYEVDICADHKDLLEGIEDTFGKAGSNPADFLYVYDDGEGQQDDPDQVKSETANAYNKVGQTAHLKGNLKKAEAVMTYLGYTQEEFKIAGEDAFNYQGVGNPHKFANIKKGEHVLDLGCGLGIDSIIASHYTGETGKVVGLDISKQEVKHAEMRAVHRGLTNIKFVVADMEQNPLPENMIDVVISNGAFCLAPNKAKAFSEIYRVLKPGGRMSICTSTVKMDLEPGVTWPVCMRMFVNISEIEPMCKEIGFENITIDTSNELMSYELPDFEEEKEAAEERKQDAENRSKNQVHVGSSEFKHLENFDMNKICSRVTVIATKPAK